jgi:hypothetical protein
VADYPSLPIAENYDEPSRDGRMVDTGADGFSRIRKLHDDRLDFVLTHNGLNASQVAALLAHYAANETSSFTFTNPDGTAYTVAYASRPQPKRHLGGVLKTYTVRLTQTA